MAKSTQAAAAQAAASSTKFLEVKVLANGRIDFVFGDGQMRSFDSEKASAEIQRLAMLHGFNQKLRDTTAGYSKEKDFSGAVAALDEVIESLLAGDWNRKGGGNGGMSFDDLCAAIAEIRGAPVAKVRDALQKLPEEKRKEYQKNQQVIAIVARMRAEREKAKADAAAPLDIDLGDETEE